MSLLLVQVSFKAPDPDWATKGGRDDVSTNNTMEDDGITFFYQKW